jgi:hypothetical protein
MEKEYIKLFRMVSKLEAKVDGRKTVRLLRIAKKVEVLVNRAIYIEEAISIPEKYQWTKGYK